MSALSDDQKRLLSEAAPLIREHLWQGTSPPPPPHPSQPPWHMGRDLSIWKRLVLHCGVSAEDLNEAIQVVRTVAPTMHGPRRMTVFYNSTGHAMPLLEQCLGYAHKHRNMEAKRKAKLPPSIQDTLRGMIGG